MSLTRWISFVLKISILLSNAQRHIKIMMKWEEKKVWIDKAGKTVFIHVHINSIWNKLYFLSSFLQPKLTNCFFLKLKLINRFQQASFCQMGTPHCTGWIEQKTELILIYIREGIQNNFWNYLMLLHSQEKKSKRVHNTFDGKL